MLRRVRLCVGAVTASLFLVVPAWGATVTVLPGNPGTGSFIDLGVADFERLGNCGGGSSVVNDGCSVVVKDDPLAPHAYGRFDPLDNYWIDSQDIDELKWTVTSPAAFNTLTFALTDAHDQPNSFFTMSIWDGAGWTEIWSIDDRLPNANLFWLMVELNDAVNMVEFLFSTKVGAGYDGFGVSTLRVSHVPLPPAALLLMTGTMLLGAVRRRREPAA